MTGKVGKLGVIHPKAIGGAKSYANQEVSQNPLIAGREVLLR